MQDGYVCGIDEAGRGPLAGPVVAACVVLGPDFPIHLLDDSKKLSQNRRARLEILIKEEALCWSAALATAQEIDRLNILEATMLAMRRAYDKIPLPIAQALIDGNRCPPLPCPTVAIVKGDATIPPIMAASIIAKETRDRIMRLASVKWPLYHFEAHKGYPTALHRQICATYGLSPIHRRSFSIVQGELF